MNGMGRSPEEIKRRNESFRMGLGIKWNGIHSPHLQAVERRKQEEKTATEKRIRDAWASGTGRGGAGGAGKNVKTTR